MNHRSLRCDGVSRRECLTLGLGGLIGMGLPELLAVRSARAAEAAPAGPAPRAKSCILVWFDGGPSHYETFDPKPDAPAEIRGEFSPIRTKIPGASFSEFVPKLAEIADRYTMLRSLRHDQGNHGAGNHYLMTGAPPRIPVGCGAFVSFHPSFGSVTSAVRGAPRGLPAYFTIPSMSRSGGPNFLGAQHAPFVVSDDPNTPDFRVRDVALPNGLGDDRFQRRTDLRDRVDRLPRIATPAAGDPAVALDEFYRQGHELISSREAQAAFDLNSEPEPLRERYGRNSFGQRALLARRLVEAGVPFVTLYSGGWDDHVDLFTKLRGRLPSIDAGLSALLTDLDDRGLLDSTLVLVLGEFGRTPKINAQAGRDHWSNAMSILVAGAGTPRGQILGATDRGGYSAVQRVVSPENLASTLYLKLGIDPGRILHTPQGRPVHIVSDPTPIDELMNG